MRKSLKEPGTRKKARGETSVLDLECEVCDDVLSDAKWEDVPCEEGLEAKREGEDRRAGIRGFDCRVLG